MVVCILIIQLVLAFVKAARPNDQIVVNSFNQTFLIADETYTFAMIPVFEVPLNINRHVIYTGTTSEVQAGLKRALVNDKKIGVSAQEFQDLSVLIEASPPKNVHINHKKRTIPSASGISVIELADGAFVSYNLQPSKKRSGQGIIGTTFCLHIPFFTTCDNSEDIEEFKNLLVQSTDEIKAELESYKQTNNARDIQLTNILNIQRNSITTLMQQGQAIATQISILASIVSVNAGTAAHGDYILHSQVNYLKRATNSLLRYSNALASTDPRVVVAQPSLSQLFEGFKQQLEIIKGQGKIPILNNNTFIWREEVLPQQSVSNVVPVSKPFMTQVNQGWTLNAAYQGTFNTNVPAVTYSLYGPFHTDHYGIYILLDSNSQPTSVTKTLKAISSTLSSQAYSPYCVQILGYKLLGSWPGQTPYMINGNLGAYTVLPLEDCNSLRLKASDPTDVLYHMFGLNEGITTPFYSNCDLTTLRTLTTIRLSYYSTWPFILNNAPTSKDRLTGVDVNERHFISSVCFINLEPEWIATVYWNSNNTKNVTDIPFGYQMNQFTINPSGSLASSLDFLYTDQWAQVYSIQRISNNKVIVDEVSMLQDDIVLFHLEGNTIVDESDAFFGPGNNGRNCIQKSLNYDYSLVDCFYQNNQKAYTAPQYLEGKIKTSGIARFTEKFDLSLQQAFIGSTPSYQFKLVPKQTSDFNFFIETDGYVCPKLLSSETYTDHCVLKFFYAGDSQVTLSNPTTQLTFFNQTSTLSVTLGSHFVRVDSKDCIIVTCQYTLEVSSVSVTTPDISIISQDDLNLQTRVDLSVHSYLNQSLAEIDSIQSQLASINSTISDLIANISSINFDLVNTIPYENFTDLTELVDGLVADIDSNPCGQPFSGFVCALEHIAIGLIFYIGITLILVLIYFGLQKAGYVPPVEVTFQKPGKRALLDDSPQHSMSTSDNQQQPLDGRPTPTTHYLIPQPQQPAAQPVALDQRPTPVTHYVLPPGCGGPPEDLPPALRTIHKQPLPHPMASDSDILDNLGAKSVD